jgi:hypothetical protein
MRAKPVNAALWPLRVLRNAGTNALNAIEEELLRAGTQKPAWGYSQLADEFRR